MCRLDRSIRPEELRQSTHRVSTSLCVTFIMGRLAGSIRPDVDVVNNSHTECQFHCVQAGPQLGTRGADVVNTQSVTLCAAFIVCRLHCVSLSLCAG